MKPLTINFLLALLISLNIVAAISTSSGNAEGRQPHSQCPVIIVEGPTDCPHADEDTIFRARIEGGDSKIAPRFNWSVSNGRVISGQGTDSFTARIDNRCETMTVTVDVDGLASGCTSSASVTTVTDCCWVVAARKFDEFGDVNCEDEMARLDMMAVELNNDPTSQGYIIFYGGRSYHGRLARRGESEARASRIKRYLLDNRGINADRVVMINGGYRERWEAEVWIAPFGAQAPTPTPTLTIKDIKFRPGRMKKSEYNCGGG